MRFFLDHCVPTSVADVLRAAGHEVIVQKDAIPTDSSDVLVAVASAANDAILVSFDKDFKSIASRIHISQKRLKKLSRVSLRCSYSQAANRVRVALSFIETEWNIAQASSDKRMFIEIQNGALRTNR